MATIEILLWADEQYASPATLRDCLGDSYLYSLNPFYRGVRDMALAQGIRFCDETEPVGKLYATATLLSLAEIQAQGTVPYKSTASALRRVLNGPLAKPTGRLPAAELSSFVPSNYVMHETSHVLADRALRAPAWAPAPPLERQEAALRAVIGEAFANAVEAAGNVFATQGPHRFLYDINSNQTSINIGPDTVALMRAQAALHGAGPLFELALWTFFFLNISPDTNQAGPGYLRAAMEAVFGDRLGDAEGAAWGALGPVLFRLNDRFRKGTTPLYFRVYGLEDDFNVLCKLDLDDPEVIAATGIARAAKMFAGWVHEWTAAPVEAEV